MPLTAPCRQRTTGLPALTLTACIVAGGVFLLRVDGRTALVSVVDLNFATKNPALKNDFLRTVGNGAQLALSVSAWTADKVLCFVGGGVVLQRRVPSHLQD